ncbi:unnamed protein product [Fusarium graminearum]|uniref:Chromosome 1, complete genome n=1 Tax=Gibberella zeae (strain ATCC MYA-4620 / CBS 123657 / FGSC 9075 / NRRL 31084 / PH-1) TaxID=229533 RepID=I1RFI6_GIBZE|nr:hypothetical protein FGSG_02463 [Fusarium graminearum PH-1]EYB31634.1 hypothetical protein FG05_02463 [Fusarium graminearum]ESU07902.1 hypothetical protein FGSG_02463 [Fusarium graminearum PH-1]CAF3452425.1 unnamed protein product [Fusarium graminearum]CAG1961426.1 unnamed protein product [Fusarium graminearum]CAG2017604.1 unnamed protein product [Fusarium graminearum]|eukprot:XP_011318387.1 hypothetical protein FGSG_02463 [Fusarium graminearum PH-1]
MSPNQPLHEIAINNNRIAPPPPFKTVDSRLADATAQTETARQGGDTAVPAPAPAPLPTPADYDALSRASHPIASITPTTSTTAAPVDGAAVVHVNSTARTTTAHAVVAAAIAKMQRKSSTDRDDGSTQSHPFSNTASQDTTITIPTDLAFTPPASDASNCLPGSSSQDSQLFQLSEIAAAQDRIGTINSSTRKRMADGEVKSRTESQSPVKGHTRTHSAVSRTSAGGHIGELSNELRTRLSYAMVKVNNGWQSNSLEEVENMASQAASPVSSTSTIHRRQGSSASPRIPMSKPPSSSAPLPQSSTTERRKSHTPPEHVWHKPSLAPPAPIRPSALSAPQVNPRRNSHPHRTPGMLSHSNSDSPHTPGQQATFQHGPKFRVTGDTVLMSPHQNVREQDAIETLLFMSSPGNSANLKHAFSPPSSSAPAGGMNRPQARHALPSGPRKPLPSQRQTQQVRKSPYDNSSMPPPPGSPMDLDSPQQQHFAPQNRAMPRRRTIGGRSQLRGTLSLPSGIGIGNGKIRKTLRDEDIERMLDQASAETGDSSDDEEILIPSRRPVAGVMRS